MRQCAFGRLVCYLAEAGHPHNGMELEGCQEPVVAVLYLGSRGDIPWPVCYGHALYKLSAPVGERLQFKKCNQPKPMRIMPIDEWIAICMETLLSFSTGEASYQDMWAFNGPRRCHENS